MLVYGAGVSTNLQARYAGADLAAPSRRGRAVSIVLVATAVGAIIGPNLVSVTGTLAIEIGIHLWLGRSCSPLPRTPRLALCCGSCCARIRCCSPAALPPDRSGPAGAAQPSGPTAVRRSSHSGRTWSWAVASGAGIMILTQLIMVAIMTMTPIHIEHHGHSINVTGLVIGAHVAGIFLPRRSRAG